MRFAAKAAQQHKVLEGKYMRIYIFNLLVVTVVKEVERYVK